MAFTYDITTNLGKVRLRIGDTVEQTYSLNDDEVNHAITLHTGLDQSAFIAHGWFLARLANYIATTAGGQSHHLDQRYRMHKEFHKELEDRANEAGEMECYAGGIDQDRIDDAQDDTDYPDPFSRVGRDDINVTYNEKKDP